MEPVQVKKCTERYERDTANRVEKTETDAKSRDNPVRILLHTGFKIEWGRLRYPESVDRACVRVSDWGIGDSEYR